MWICPDPRGHLQATGRDARGRKQYRYHPRWREVRDETKYHRHDRLRAGAARDPAADRRRPPTRRVCRSEKVLAAVVQLLEKTLIRVGNDEYARTEPVVRADDAARRARGGERRDAVTFSFRGKSGVEHEIDLDDRRLARIVKACRDLPGYELFQYLDEDGRRQTVGSSDVNAYLRRSRRGLHVEGLPHVGRHGARRAAAAASSSGSTRKRRPSGTSSRPSSRSRSGSATPKRSAASATSTRPCSTRTWMGRCWRRWRRVDVAARGMRDRSLQGKLQCCGLLQRRARDARRRAS